jgi:hypothetical protein
MISPQAQTFWDTMRSAPQQISLPLPARRAAGELAETATSEPSGVKYVGDNGSGGLWALPSTGRGETACLSQLFLAGDSSGGGLAAAVALAAIDAELPALAGVVALSPWADLTCSSGTMMTSRTHDIAATREGLLEMAQWYLKGADPGRQDRSASRPVMKDRDPSQSSWMRALPTVPGPGPFLFYGVPD